MEKEDFEALGRYTYAMDQAAAVGSQLSVALHCLGHDMGQHVKREGGALSCVAAIQDRIKKINELYNRLADLREMAEEAGKKCGKPPFEPYVRVADLCKMIEEAGKKD